MRKLLIIFLLVSGFLQNQSNAQTYHPFLNNNIYWDVGFADMGFICMPFGNSGPWRMSLSRDTVINSVNYSLFEVYDFLSSPPKCPPFVIDTNVYDENIFGQRAIMREDTLLQRVYKYDQAFQQEILWYDFNAQIGDTLFYDGVHFVVDTLYDIVTLDGKTRTYFEYNNNSHGGLGGYYIEGLGGRGGPFYEPLSYFEGGPWLMCILDTNQNLIYSGNMGPCYGFLTTGIKDVIRNKVDIHPNPTQEKLTVSLGEAKTGILRVLNSLGQAVLEDDFKGVTELTLSLDGPSGLYFLQLEIDGDLITKKVVRE